MKYKFARNYKAVMSTAEGEIVLNYQKGDEAEFSEPVAAWINRDAPGALKKTRKKAVKQTRQLTQASHNRGKGGKDE